VKSTKLIKKLLFTAFLTLSSFVNLFAQCEGVNFKTSYRKLFTQPVVFIPELQTNPERFKDSTGDGNGIFDLAVFRPFTSCWYSYHTSEQESFGSADEFPTSSLIKPQ